MTNGSGLDPFAPPKADVDGLPTGGAARTFFARRVGANLMVEKRAPLPHVCVKCARRDRLELRDQNFIWTPPWVYLFILIGLLIFIILAMVLRKQGKLDLPICRECHRRWRLAVLWSALSVLWLLGALFGSFVPFASDFPALGILLLLSAVAAPLLVQILVYRPRTLRACHIDETTITVVGLHPETQAAILEAAAGTPAGTVPSLEAVAKV